MSAAPQELLAPSSKKAHSPFITPSSQSEFGPFLLHIGQRRSRAGVAVAGWLTASFFLLVNLCREIRAGGGASQSVPEEEGPQGDMKSGHRSRGAYASDG